MSSAVVDTSPRVIDFFKLPRPIQDRVVASLTGNGVPTVLAYRPNSSWQVYRWALAALVMFAALVTLGVLDFGKLGAANALHGTQFLPVYLVLGALFGLAGVGFVLAGRPSEYPFALGTYLLPSGVLVVARRHLVASSVADLETVEATGQGKVRLTFASRSFVLALPSGTLVESLRSELEGYRSAWGEAFRNGDRRTLAGMDPVRDSGFSNPLSSRAALSRQRTRATPRVLAGVVLGTLLGLVFFFGRNALAERNIYRKAVTANTLDAYRAYLANGGRRPDVTEWRLPQAELIAVSGDLAAVESYAREHPESKIRSDVEKLLRLELLKELQRVRSAADLAALDSFKAQHPDAELVSEELAGVRAEVFRAALASFDQKFSPSADASAFFTRLVAHAEKHGPTVDVRIRRELPPSMDRADVAIRKSAYFTGQKSEPSQYFRDEHAAAREKRVLDALIGALQPAFSPNVLHFEARVGEVGSGVEPKVDRPTLLVSYKTEMSGGYTTNRPRGVYVGLGMMFQAAGLVPDVTETFRFRDSSWLPPDINEISKNLLSPEQVYEANANEGFERFLNRLLARLLGEKSAVRVELTEGANR